MENSEQNKPPASPKSTKANAFLIIQNTKIIIPSIVIILLTALVVLNYFNILSLSKFIPVLNFLPQKTISSDKVAFKCPVQEKYCKLGKKIKYQGNPAIVYELPSGTPILSAAQVADFRQYTIQPYKKGGPKALFLSSLDSKECYIATYTIPFDTTINAVSLLPIPQGYTMATASANPITTDAGKTNLIFQIQKRALDKSKVGRPGYEQCPTVNLKPKEFGQYLPLDSEEFFK